MVALEETTILRTSPAWRTTGVLDPTTVPSSLWVFSFSMLRSSDEAPTHAEVLIIAPIPMTFPLARRSQG